MQRQGLITLQDTNCISTRRIPVRCSCWRRWRAKRRQRYAITFWLLSANCPSTAVRWRKESRTVAQRLSVLHVLTRRSFLMRGVQFTVRDAATGYTGVNAIRDAEPAETMKIYQMLRRFSSVINGVRLTIESATQGE